MPGFTFHTQAAKPQLGLSGPSTFVKKHTSFLNFSLVASRHLRIHPSLRHPESSRRPATAGLKYCPRRNGHCHHTVLPERRPCDDCELPATIERTGQCR
jgi:hypothetical protein